MSGLPNPTPLEGEVRFIQATDQHVTTRSPRMVAECLLASSTLNKIYYLVANPEGRISRDVAHFKMVYQFIAVHQSNTI